MVKIIEDTRQQAGKHRLKHRGFAELGVELDRKKLDVGDYMVPIDAPTVTIDTKRHVGELAQNLTAGHARFTREIKRAQELGLTLYVVIEDPVVKNLDDLRKWINPHCRFCPVYKSGKCNPRNPGRCDHPRHKSKVPPAPGSRLAKMMRTMEKYYPVNFVFCHPKDTAKVIMEILPPDLAKCEEKSE